MNHVCNTQIHFTNEKNVITLQEIPQLFPIQTMDGILPKEHRNTLRVYVYASEGFGRAALNALGVFTAKQLS
jgi:hypothetical protein